ncbi:hypothetical protein COOONC_04589 [Cooperia oncophora]
MSSVNGCQSEPSYSDRTETPSRSVTNIKEEAEKEYEQLRRIEERLNQLAKTCVQSNLPHVIREIRATIESKLAEILPEAGTSDAVPTRNRLRTRQEALLELGQSPGPSAARPVHKRISTPAQQARSSSTSPSHTDPSREPVDAKKKSSEATPKYQVEEHVLSRIAGFAAAVEASRRKRVLLPTSLAREDDVTDRDYLASKTDGEIQRREDEASTSMSRSSALQSNCEVVQKQPPVTESSASDQEKRERRRVLKRIYVRKGPQWVLKKVVVEPTVPNSSTEDEHTSSSHHSRETHKDHETEGIVSNKEPRNVKHVIVKASSVPRLNSVVEASSSRTQVDQGRNEIKGVPENSSMEPQKIIERVMVSGERSVKSPDRRNKTTPREDASNAAKQ